MIKNQFHHKINNSKSENLQKEAHIIGLNESPSKKEEKIEDQNLWLKLKVGSEDAFQELFLKYNHILTNYGYSIVQDSFLIEDCIHDLFLYLWTNRSTLCEVESVKYYLIVSFRRRIFKSINEVEKGKKLLDGIKLEYPQFESFFEKKFIENQEQFEIEKRVNDYIELLPPGQKQVLLFRYVSGMSYQEISTRLGVSTNTVRKQSSKAIRNLRKNFQ